MTGDRSISWEYIGEELAIFWENPYEGGKKEKIASFWWPLHPIEATTEVETFFESIAGVVAKDESLKKALAAIAVMHAIREIKT